MSGSDVDNVENVVGKSGWLLGTITKPNATDPKFVQWEIDNCTILGWLFNSMEPRIYHVFMYHDIVPLLWSSLTKMYAHACNEACIFEFYREIHQASQASLSLSVVDYFAYLQSRWEELAQYEPLSEFTTEGGIAARRLDRQHTYQFLMGLKPEFEALRTQIVNTTPMPSIFETFAMPDGDERRHRLLQLPPPPVTESTIPDQMALAASGSHFSGGRSSSGRAPCSFCGGVTYGRDRCFKLHPELRETFKRNKEKSKASPRTAAISETSYGSPAAPTALIFISFRLSFRTKWSNLVAISNPVRFSYAQSPCPNPSPSTATLASGYTYCLSCTPHSLNPHQEEAPEDPSIFFVLFHCLSPLRWLLPTLPPVLTSNPRHMYSRHPPASDPLPQSSSESGNIFSYLFSCLTSLSHS
ncbi:hypothetical protein Acr_01g0011040 [Actinidia rufa]|uniref:Uncharacterized protein n=1 Tax=Actinidia rufa TaxID=165716 RepID=A0A7J0E4J0_9ERIC|nr:hypothetical protein Acr_01g0011040 [Actinidia rufa]